MGDATLESWQGVAAAKRASLLESIPQEWRIPESLLPPEEQLDVTSFPSKSGWFTSLELDITSTSASEICQKIRAGEWSAKVVVSAYCKRAAAAQQLASYCLASRG